MAELPSISVDAGYRVVTEEQLLKGGQAIQGAAVHLCQTVVLQVTVRDENNKQIINNEQNKHFGMWEIEALDTNRRWTGDCCLTVSTVSLPLINNN